MVLCNQDTWQHFWDWESGWELLWRGPSSAGCTGAPFAGPSIPQSCPRGGRRRSPSLRKPTSFRPFAKYRYWMLLFLWLLFYLPKAYVCLFPTHSLMLSLKGNLPRRVVSRGSDTKPSWGKGTQRLVHLSSTRSWWHRESKTQMSIAIDSPV